MRLLTQISLMTVAALALTACSGGSSDPVKPRSPYAGLWMGKELAEFVRTQKESTANCDDLNSVPHTLSYLIDSDGGVHEFLLKDSKEILNKEAKISSDGIVSTVKPINGAPQLRASLHENTLTITTASVGEAENIHFVKTTRAEIIRATVLVASCNSQKSSQGNP